MILIHDLFHKRGNQYADLSAGKAKFRFIKSERIETEEKTKRHLQNIGIVAGSKIVVVNLSGNNAILLVKSHRVAVSREILGQIFVNKKTASSDSWTSLDQLKAGERLGSSWQSTDKAQ